MSAQLWYVPVMLGLRFPTLAAWLVLSCCVTSTVQAEEPDRAGRRATAEGDVHEQAAAAFEAGDEAFDVQDYEAALGHYQRAFSLVSSPNAKLMIARSLVELDRLAAAYREYEVVLQLAADDERYAETYASAERERAALKSRLAWVRVEAGDLPSGASLSVDGEPAQESFGQKIPLNPGTHSLKAESSDGKSASAVVHVAAGRVTAVTLQDGQEITVGTPPKKSETDGSPNQQEAADRPGDPAEQSASLRPWAYVSGGVGVVGMAAFGTFGFLSTQRYDELEQTCASSGLCPPEAASDIDEGKQFQLLANIGLGVGVAGLTTAVMLFLLEPKRERPGSGDSASALDRRARGRGSVGGGHFTVDVGLQHVVVRGTF